MTHPRGRTGHGSAPRGVRAAACVAVALAGAAGGCARPGNTPSGTPDRSVTIVASAVAVAPSHRPPVAAPGLVPGNVGGCGGTGVAARPTGSLGPRRAPAVPPAAPPAMSSAAPPAAPPAMSSAAPPAAPPAMTSAAPPATPDLSAEDARDRARRVLEAQRSAIPRRGDVPPGIAARAVDCIVLLQAELSLRRAAHGTPTPDDVRAALTAARLTGAVVRPDLRFAASTGDACIVGAAGPAEPEVAVAPLTADGTCRP